MWPMFESEAHTLAYDFTLMGDLSFPAERMAVMFRSTFGPDVLIGWTNRLLILTYSAWLITVAWQAIRLSKQGQ